MLGGDVGLVVLARQAEGALHDRDHARREGELGRLGGLVAGLRGEDLVELGANVLIGDLEGPQRLGGDALALLGEREQQVLGAHLVGLARERLLLRHGHGAARAVGESI